MPHDPSAEHGGCIGDAMTYRAPVKDMLFCMKELAGLDAVAAAAGLRGRRPRDGAGRARGMREVQRRRGRAAQPATATTTPRRGSDGEVTTTPGFKQAFRAVRRRRLAGPAAPGRVRRAGPAEDDRRGLRRDAQQRQPELRAVPAADRRRDRGAAHRRHATSSSTTYIPKMISRRVDRHDEPDRAAGRQRPRRWCARAPSRRPTAATSSSAPRSSSPTASTTWPRTSSTWCSRA